MQLPSLSSVILIISFLVLLRKLIFRKSGVDLLPGPPKLPLIGNLYNLVGISLPHKKLYSLSKAYGPLFHLKLGQINFIIVTSADLACEILKTQDLTFASRPESTAAKALCNGQDGIVTSPYGPYWRELRKICTLEVLSTKRVKSYSFIRQEEGTKLVKEILKLSQKGSAVNLSKLLLSLSNSMVVRACFGKELRERDRFIEAMKEIENLATAFQWVDLFPSLRFLSGLINGVGERLKKVWKDMDAILVGVIEDTNSRRGVDGDSGTESLIEILLKIKEKGDFLSEFNDDHIKAIIIDMFIAGTGTSASTMEWGMTALIKNPNVMKKVQQEIRTVVGEKERIEESDIEEMPYLKLVIKEIFRLYPPSPLLFRRVIHENTKISGITLPVGSRILINNGAIGKDPNNWKDPEIFWPERFEESHKDFRGADFDFTPFGAGRRICPGIMFGLTFVELWIANLLYYFDWELPDGKKPEELDMDEDYNLVISRKNNLYLMATPRYQLRE